MKANELKSIADNASNPDEKFHRTVENIESEMMELAKNGEYEFYYHDYSNDNLALIKKYFKDNGFNIINGDGFINNTIYISWKV
jgi:hypothetical protein